MNIQGKEVTMTKWSMNKVTSTENTPKIEINKTNITEKILIDGIMECKG